MADTLTIARPYAKALFEQALADSAIDAWTSILDVLSHVAQDAEVNALFDDPRVRADQLQTLLIEIVAQTVPTLKDSDQKMLAGLLTLLIQEKRLGVLPDVFKRYQRLVAKQQEVLQITVTSAHLLDEARRDNMSQALQQYLKSQVAVDFYEDPSLIGGAIIRTGYWVMDGSIKGKLQRLRDNLV